MGTGSSSEANALPSFASAAQRTAVLEKFMRNRVLDLMTLPEMLAWLHLHGLSTEALVSAFIEYGIDGEAAARLRPDFWRSLEPHVPTATIDELLAQLGPLYSASHADAARIRASREANGRRGYPDRKFRSNPIKALVQYHLLSQHTEDASSVSLGRNWASQPRPFRRYFGTRLEPMCTPLVVDSSHGLARDASLDQALSSLLFLSLAVSARVDAPGAAYTKRVNPSSGGLHPVECYAVDPSGPRLWHYAAQYHALELLRCARADTAFAVSAGAAEAPELLLCLTGLHWREVWKYGERGYRYAQLDAGHALGAVLVAAQLIGWTAHVLDDWDAEAVARALGLAEVAPDASEYEDPFAVIALYRTGLAEGSDPAGRAAHDARLGAWLADAMLPALQGACAPGPAAIVPNRISLCVDACPAVRHVHALMRPQRSRGDHHAPAPESAWRTPMAVASPAVVRARRSAHNFVPEDSALPLASFLAMVDALLSVPAALAHVPNHVSVGLAVHRVRELSPGLYFLVRAPHHAAALPVASWRPSGLRDQLYAVSLASTDEAQAAVRLQAQHSCCDQGLADNGAFACHFFADVLDASVQTMNRTRSAFGYRQAHMEAGLLGHMLYLAAARAGTSACGMGCFLDDAARELFFGTRPASEAGEGFVPLYGFGVGAATADSRRTPHDPCTALALAVADAAECIARVRV